MKFAEPTESAFLHEHMRDMLAQWRFSIALGAVLTSAWAVWDWSTAPRLATQMTWIRFGFVVPALAVLFALTCVKPMQRPAILQWIVSGAAVVGALGILAMREVAGMGAHATNYYPDLMLVYAFTYTFLRLQFIYPTLISWGIFVVYVVLSAVDPRISSAHLAFSSFYLVSANIIGMFACYNIERSHRNEFLLRNRNLELLEKAERASRDKTRFLAAASHDLKQPIHALGLWIRNLRNAAQRGDITDVTRKVETIEGSIQALGSSFDGILQISRLDAGAIAVHLEDVELDAMLGQIELIFRPLAVEKGLSLAMKWRPDAPAWVRTDRILLDRALKNLVANAIKFTSYGGVRIETRKAPAGCVIDVVDSGPGIPAEFREDIFKEFFQIGNIERDSKQGQGLGLSIVRRIVDSLEGHSLAFDSTPGVGSRFSITLPAAAARARIAAQAMESSSQARLANVYVLVVEDDRTVREGLIELLGGWGAILDAAVGEDDARAAVRRNERRPDLIVTDLRLPGGTSGIELAGELRCELQHQVPVLVVTGDNAQSAELHSLGGLATLVTKPVNPDYLLSVIETLIARSAESRRIKAGPDDAVPLQSPAGLGS